jgi:hypothetical protein
MEDAEATALSETRRCRLRARQLRLVAQGSNACIARNSWWSGGPIPKEAGPISAPTSGSAEIRNRVECHGFRHE